MTEDNAEKIDKDVMDEPPARFKERTSGVQNNIGSERHETGIQTGEKPDGTCHITITAPNQKNYKVETRINHNGALELVLFDSESKELIESFGTADELVELNAMAAQYAKSIHTGDEVGQALVELVDSEDVQENITVE